VADLTQPNTLTRKKGGRLRLPFADIVLALFAGLPILALVLLALSSFEGSGGLRSPVLPVALQQTGMLLLITGIATGALGLLSAWLVAHFEFPGRRIFEWAFILPLAIPTYISAYAWTEFMGFMGAPQGLVRSLTGAQTLQDYWFPQLRGIWGAAFVMSLVLYPYVYLSCRAFFLMQSGSVSVAARTLGASASRTFFKVVLPLSRPALIVGVTLVLMEVMNDLGAVEFFGVRTLTAVIYATWINRANLAGAAQLAVTLVLLMAALIWLEQYARRSKSYLMNRDNRTPPPRVVLGFKGMIGAVLFSITAIGLGFGVPLYQLASTAVGRILRGSIPDGVWSATLNTVFLAAAGALLCLVLGYITARRVRASKSRAGRTLTRLAILGYAVPGTVLAIGVVYALGTMDGWINAAARNVTGAGIGLIMSGSVFALLYAYSVRFLTLSHNSFDAAIKKRGDSMIETAQVLGSGPIERFFRVEVPTLRPALIGAATLVFVDIVKELPATLLLRPIGVDTLATYVYAQAHIERFEAASVPAMIIIAVAIVPALLAGRLQDSRGT
jgi:iron(III) transport system permease protein